MEAIEIDNFDIFKYLIPRVPTDYNIDWNRLLEEPSYRITNADIVNYILSLIPPGYNLNQES